MSALEVMAVVLNNYPPLYRQFTGSVSFMSRSGDWPQVVPCQDGWIGLCVFTPQQWSDFAAMIGREDLSADDRLNSMGGRGRNRALAESVVRPWLETHTVAEICELGELFRVPVAQVGNGRDVLAMDHFVERGVFVEHPEGFVAPRPPFLSTTSPAPAAQSAAAPSGPLPLSGVTVLDLTAFWAGPACTHQLATLGADVIKVESPFRPDGMRFATVRPPTEPDWMEYGPTFHGTNPGKRSITIDFSTPEGRELVLRLVERADVVVENFTPRVLGNVGLEYEDLVARRGDVILLRMPAFGLDGPWRDRPGFAQTTEQVSGIAWMTGEAGGEALVRSTIDPIAGIHGAFAVLAALAHRERTGEGQQIEMPMAEVAMNVAAEPIVTWSAYGTLLQRDGDRGAPGAPQGVYACAGTEQWVAVSITDDREWRALVTVLGDPEWARDPELATGAGRRARHDALDASLSEWFAPRDRDDTVEQLLAAGVLAAPVWDQMIQDELPQLAERGFTQWLEHPIAGPVGYPGTGVRADTFDNSYRAPHRPSASTPTTSCTSSASRTPRSRPSTIPASSERTHRSAPNRVHAGSELGQVVRWRRGPAGRWPSTSVKPYSSARSRAETAVPDHRVTFGSVASATTARPMNRGDSEVLRSRVSGSRPIAAPTSMRSVRTKPGQTETTDTASAPCCASSCAVSAVMRSSAHFPTP